METQGWWLRRMLSFTNNRLCNRPSPPRCEILKKYLNDIGFTWPEPEPTGDDDYEPEWEASRMGDPEEEASARDADWEEGEEEEEHEQDEEVDVEVSAPKAVDAPKAVEPKAPEEVEARAPKAVEPEEPKAVEPKEVGNPPEVVPNAVSVVTQEAEVASVAVKPNVPKQPVSMLRGGGSAPETKCNSPGIQTPEPRSIAKHVEQTPSPVQVS